MMKKDRGSVCPTLSPEKKEDIAKSQVRFSVNAPTISPMATTVWLRLGKGCGYGKASCLVPFNNKEIQRALHKT